MGTCILFTKLDTGIFLISYWFLSYQNKQQYCPCMQTLRNAFNVNGIHQWEPTDDASIEKSTYSFCRILWNEICQHFWKKNPTDDLLFSSKSQMKRKTKLAICSLINSVGNVKSKGTEDQIHCEKKKLSTNNGNEVEIRWNRETWGNVENQEKRECNQMCSASGTCLVITRNFTITPAGAFKLNAHTCCSVVWMCKRTW